MPHFGRSFCFLCGNHSIIIREMIFISKFNLPGKGDEDYYFTERVGAHSLPTYYDSYYPFRILDDKGLECIEFSDITIFSGGNGSGKSTVLNVMAEKLGLRRESQINRTELFDDYVNLADYTLAVYDPEEKRRIMEVSRIITSDDVFNHILKLRKRNEDIDFKRTVIKEQRRTYFNNPLRTIDFEDPDSYRRYKDYADMTSKSFSKYIVSRKVLNERTYSNGESGYKYFIDAIQPNGLYLLDEPENSLSASLQVELADYLAGMARFYDCQFIISSHSPFIQSIPFARIYDMDSDPVKTVKWTDIPSVRVYHDFFLQHSDDFQPLD